MSVGSSLTLVEALKSASQLEQRRAAKNFAAAVGSSQLGYCNMPRQQHVAANVASLSWSQAGKNVRHS
eukprot:s740_g18.t4